MANESNKSSWFDAITRKIGGLLSEEEAQNVDASTSTDEMSATIESKENLRHDVVDMLSSLIDDAKQAEGRSIRIWMDADQLTFDSYNSDAYRAQLEDALVNECGFCFEKIELQIGVPDETLRATPVGNSGKIYLQVIARQETATHVSHTATISIFGDAGSLMQEQYVLSSDEMRERGITAYNIGAGQTPKVPKGYRENHIAIDNDPNSPMVDKNKFVSRMHAHIGFSDRFGFYLQVEIDGTRLMGKRTRIFRGEEKIECENPQAKVPLQDGDLIELGKAVVLKYSENQ